MEQFKGQPRLPKFAVPKGYDITFKPDLTACNLAGAVAVELEIISDIWLVVLKAADLSVDAASVSFTHRDSSSKWRSIMLLNADVDEIISYR